MSISLLRIFGSAKYFLIASIPLVAIFNGGVVKGFPHRSSMMRPVRLPISGGSTSSWFPPRKSFIRPVTFPISGGSDMSRFAPRKSFIRFLSLPISGGRTVSLFPLKSSTVRLVTFPISGGNFLSLSLLRSSLVACSSSAFFILSSAFLYPSILPRGVPVCLPIVSIVHQNFSDFRCVFSRLISYMKSHRITLY